MGALHVEASEFATLRESSASFQMLAQYVESCAVYLLDRQGMVATWNSGAQRLKQYTAEEIIGRHFSTFYLPEEAATGKPNAQLAWALSEGRAEFEGWRKRKDGSLFRAHIVITPIFDGQNRHLGFGKVTCDISGELSQQHMRSVLDHVLDGILSTDEHGAIQSFNLAAETIFGYRQAEILGRDVKMLISGPYHATRDKSGWLTATTRSAGANRQETGLRRDGSTFPLELAISSFELEGRLFFTGIARDLSDRVDEEARLRAILDNASDAITTVDERGIVRSFNLAAEAMYGYSEAEITGREVYLLLPEAQRHFFKKLVERISQGEQIVFHNVEGQGQRRDGSVFPLELSLNTVAQGGKRIIIGLNRDITARKAADDALQHSQRRMENAQRVAHVGDWEWDTASGSITWSDEYYRILGFEPQSFVPDYAKAMEVVHPDDRENIAAVAEHGRALGGRTLVDYRIMRPDGEVRYVEGRGEFPAIDAAAPRSEEQLISGTLLDVTERARGELRLRAILDNVSDGIVTIDEAGIVQTFNRTAERIYGYAEAEITGKEIFGLSPPDRRDHLREVVRGMCQGEQPPSLSFGGHGLRKDGTLFPREITLNVFVLGDRHYVISTIRDITERQLADDALRFSRERMESAQREAHIGDWEWDIVRDQFSVSDEFFRIYGLEPQSVVLDLAKGLELIFPEDRERIAAEVQEVLASGASHRFEYRLQRPDGELRYVDGHCAVLPRPDGQPALLRGTLQDITERKLAQQGQKKLEEELRQSQKMEAVGKLAGGVAHDFNNMLTVINGYSEIVLAQLPQESELVEFITQILLAGERAALLTSQLLAFSRQQVLAPRVLDLNHVIEETEKMLQRLIGEDISIATSLDPQLSRILVDQGQIVQVIMNLTVNARDAMPQGGKLTIKTSNLYVDEERARQMPDYRPGPHVVLTVSDNGSGMPPEVKARIFEPFFTTKSLGEGTGLGLSTVYGIIKQSGGQIEVYSEQGVGTAFMIYFPAVEVTAESLLQPEVVLIGGTETILLVEDDPAVRNVAVAMLQARGYNLLVADSGAEALELARTHPERIDLLLTDLIMPEMSGRQVAEAIVPLLPGVKVLYMSGYTDDAVVRHGLVSASVAFLQKPFTSVSLAGKVREVLDKAE